MVHAVLRESPSASAFSSSERNPASIRACPSSRILADWRAFISERAPGLVLVEAWLFRHAATPFASAERSWQKRRALSCALKQHCVAHSFCGNVGVILALSAVVGHVWNSVAVQERLYRSQADCEGNILCCLARRFGNLNRIKFTRNNPDDAAAPVQQWTSAVGCLNRRAD